MEVWESVEPGSLVELSFDFWAINNRGTTSWTAGIVKTLEEKSKAFTQSLLPCVKSAHFPWIFRVSWQWSIIKIMIDPWSVIRCTSAMHQLSALRPQYSESTKNNTLTRLSLNCSRRKRNSFGCKSYSLSGNRTQLSRGTGKWQARVLTDIRTETF